MNRHTAPLPWTQHPTPEKYSYKRTLVFDPSKSETFKALQEDYGYGNNVHEIPINVQPKIYHHNRLVPGKVSVKNFH